MSGAPSSGPEESSKTASGSFFFWDRLEEDPFFFFAIFYSVENPNFEHEEMFVYISVLLDPWLFTCNTYLISSVPDTVCQNQKPVLKNKWFSPITQTA